MTKIKKKEQTFDDFKQEMLSECKLLVNKMIDRNQNNKIRIKGATLIGLLVKYNSLGDPEAFNQGLLQKMQHLCQDIHWEVRKEMCSYLIEISRHIGQQKSEAVILPEIKELLEDEEGEVITEAFIQYQKHLSSIFSLKFVKSQENLDIYYKFCDYIQKSDFLGIDLAIILKKLSKVIVTLDRPQDTEFTDKLQELI